MFKVALKRLCWGVLNCLPDAVAVRIFYFRTFRRFPNLSKPSTFNEKITWRKLHQPNERFKIFADRIAVKPEIARIMGDGYVIKTLWIGDSPDDIPFNQLTAPYVIKTNHGNGGHIFIRTSADINKAAIAASLQKQLAYSHAHRWREWGYRNIPRKILVEEMILDTDGEVPTEYKFFVYHGRVQYILVIYSRFTDVQRAILDRNWQRVPVSHLHPCNWNITPQPARLAEMISAAETIGSEFDFARVDLYATAGWVKFGEVTFYPAAGLGRFEPAEWDAKFGEPWRLPPKFI